MVSGQELVPISHFVWCQRRWLSGDSEDKHQRALLKQKEQKLYCDTETACHARGLWRPHHRRGLCLAVNVFRLMPYSVFCCWYWYHSIKVSTVIINAGEFHFTDPRWSDDLFLQVKFLGVLFVVCFVVWTVRDQLGTFL